MKDEYFEKLREIFAAFTLGQLQDFRTVLKILIANNISREVFIEFVTKAANLHLDDASASPVGIHLPKVACPQCNRPMAFRALRGLKSGYRSNFVCDNCSYDHYDVRSVQEVLREGIRIYTSEGVD